MIFQDWLCNYDPCYMKRYAIMLIEKAQYQDNMYSFHIVSLHLCNNVLIVYVTFQAKCTNVMCYIQAIYFAFHKIITVLFENMNTALLFQSLQTTIQRIEQDSTDIIHCSYFDGIIRFYKYHVSWRAMIRNVWLY